MGNWALKNRIHRKTAVVLAVLLIVTLAAYFFSDILPSPFGIPCWLILLPASAVVAIVRVANTELLFGKSRPNKDEMVAILSGHLSKFRTWSYAQLVERVERDRREHECLESIEGTTSDGTAYSIELSAFWDDQPGGGVRVCAHLSAEPQKPLWSFLPINTPDASDGFLMSPNGRFVGE